MSYNHGEAFCLMTYKCQRCGRTEQIWNSRDGVTPFITTCYIEGCGGESQHINWQHDQHMPNYQLSPGDRFFRDGTDEEARESYRQRVMSNPQYVPEDKTPEQVIEELCASIGTEHSDFRKGWPHLEMVPLLIPPEPPYRPLEYA